MQLFDLPVCQLQDAVWNPNVMAAQTTVRLTASITRYGLVQNLVVRPISDDRYEVLSGNQRLRVLQQSGVKTAPCVVVELNDANAKLLSQALNRIQGEDDLGLKADLLRTVLEDLPQEQVLTLLPETAESLTAFASLNQETMAEHLQNWQRAQAARLKHVTFQLTTTQQEVVEEAMSQLLPLAKGRQGDSPNSRGTALYLLCLGYLERRENQA